MSCCEYAYRTVFYAEKNIIIVIMFVLQEYWHAGQYSLKIRHDNLAGLISHVLKIIEFTSKENNHGQS